MIDVHGVCQSVCPLFQASRTSPLEFWVGGLFITKKKKEKRVQNMQQP